MCYDCTWEEWEDELTLELEEQHLERSLTQPEKELLEEVFYEQKKWIPHNADGDYLTNVLEEIYQEFKDRMGKESLVGEENENKRV